MKPTPAALRLAKATIALQAAAGYLGGGEAYGDVQGRYDEAVIEYADAVKAVCRSTHRKPKAGGDQ